MVRIQCCALSFAAGLVGGIFPFFTSTLWCSGGEIVVPAGMIGLYAL